MLQMSSGVQTSATRVPHHGAAGNRGRAPVHTARVQVATSRLPLRPAQGEKLCSRVNFYPEHRPPAPLLPLCRPSCGATSKCWRHLVKVKSLAGSGLQVARPAKVTFSPTLRSPTKVTFGSGIREAVTFAANERFVPGRCHSKATGRGCLEPGAAGRGGAPCTSAAPAGARAKK